MRWLQTVSSCSLQSTDQLACQHVPSDLVSSEPSSPHLPPIERTHTVLYRYFSKQDTFSHPNMYHSWVYFNEDTSLKRTLFSAPLGSGLEARHTVTMQCGCVIYGSYARVASLVPHATNLNTLHNFTVCINYNTTTDHNTTTDL